MLCCINSRIAALLLLLVASPAGAGVVYRYTSTYDGNPLSKGSSGTVWVSGQSYRHVLDPNPSNPRAWDVAVSDGTTTRLINTGNQTWYEEKEPEIPRGAMRGKPSKIKVTHHVEEDKHVIRANWRLTETFGGTKVGSSMSVTLLLWTTPEFPSVPLRRFITTGERQVDVEIEHALAAIEGMPLRYELATTRTYDGGKPSTFLVKTTFSDVEIVDIPASKFQVPSTYREQEPVIAVPGVISR